MLRRSAAFARWLAFTAVCYGVAVQVGLELRDPESSIALFWPAAGVGAALMIRARRRSRLAVVAVVLALLIDNLVLNLSAGHSLGTSLGFTLANALEPLVVATTYTRLRRRWPEVTVAMPLLVIAALAGVATSTPLAVALLTPSLPDPWWQIAATWSVPDIAGVAAVGPALLAPLRLPNGRWREAIGQGVVSAGLTVLVFWSTSGIPIAWLSLPALVWSAQRLGISWTALNATTVAVSASVAGIHGRGPFGVPAHSVVNLLSAQAFSVVIGFTALATATAVAERERVARMLALQDPLTGLPNRRWFTEHAEGILTRRPREGTIVAVLYCDLDGFKAINDTYGHHVGDEVLRVTAQRLVSAVRPTDMVARLGGDEFAILCPGIDHRAEAESIRERLGERCGVPIVVDGAEVVPEVSVGLVLMDDHSSLEDLLHEADQSMYLAKRGAKERRRAALPAPRTSIETDVEHRTI